MVDRLLNNANMNTSVTTAWTDVPGERHINVQVHWTGVTGTLNGSLVLEGTNDQSIAAMYTVIDTIAVTTTNNDNNAHVWDIVRAYAFMRVRYTKGGITGGTMNIRVSK